MLFLSTYLNLNYHKHNTIELCKPLLYINLVLRIKVLFQLKYSLKIELAVNNRLYPKINSCADLAITLPSIFSVSRSPSI